MQTGAYDRREALPAGTVLREYSLESVLGRGGFGIVYRARRNEGGHVVAIKEFLPIGLAVRDGETVRPRRDADSPDFEDAVSQFLDEARAFVAFRGHASVVACHDSFRAHGTGYLVMDFEEGLSLEEVLASREAEGRPFGDEDLLEVTVPLLEGLASMHRSGLLHRDLNPSNILIREGDKQPVMIDFGLAKHFVTQRSESLDPYTEGYAPLELVADAGAPGAWTDIYGIGAVMWRMVAVGQRPWDPPDPIRVERRSHAALGGKRDPLPSARKLGAGRFVPNRLATIDRCLRLREGERVESCDELLDALKDESRDPTGAWVFADTARSTETARKRRTRRVAAAAIATVAVLAVVLMGGWIPDVIDLVTGLKEPEATSPQTPDTASVANSPTGGGSGADRRGRIDASESLAPIETSEQVGDSTESGAAERDAQAAIELASTPGRRFRDCDACPEMIEVPIGSYVMGSIGEEVGGFPDEWPTHRVSIRYRLAVGVYEVTFGEWDACVVAGACDRNVADDEGWGRGRRPVNVSWENAQKFLQWLGTETGEEYRLPSEAEWEYVARAGTTTRYHFGDAISKSQANHGGNVDKAVVVGSYPANAFGLHDVHGNVWEWIADCWNDSYFDAPSDGSAWLTGDCGQRVVRGGSWVNDAGTLRSALRYSLETGHWSNGVGFRVARTIDP